MNCKKCGFQLTENDQFCRNCGETINPQVNLTNNVGVNNPNPFGQPVQSAGTSNTSQPNLVNNVGVNNPNPFGQPVQGPGTSNTPQPNPVNSMGVNPVNQFSSQPINPVNNQNYNGSATKSINGIDPKYIIIGVVVLILIVGGVFVVKNMKNSNGGLNSIIANKSTYPVRFDGITLNIPSDLITEEDDEGLSITDDINWYGYIQLMDGSFEKLKANKNGVVSTLKSNGVDVKNINIKTIKNQEVVLLEVISDGQSGIFAYFKFPLNAGKIVYTAVVSEVKDYDYDKLEKMIEIVLTAKYEQNSYGIKSTTLKNALKSIQNF